MPAKSQRSPDDFGDEDFIPKDDMDFDAWLHNFVTQLEALGPAKFGISPVEMAELKASYKKWADSYDAHLKAQSNLRASEQNLKAAEQKLKDAKQKLKDAQQEGEEWKGGG
jgi:hypothetical protein